MNGRDRLPHEQKPTETIDITSYSARTEKYCLFEIGFYDPQGRYHLVTRKGTWVDCQAFRALKLGGAIAEGYSIAIFYHG